MASLTRIDPFSINGIDPLEDVLKGFFRPVNLDKYYKPTLKVDVQEHDTQYILQAELPGIDKEDIHVTIDGNHVAISAESKTVQNTTEKSTTLRSERYFGKVARSFAFEKDIDEAKAVAEHKNGVLTLTLPKKVEVAAKRLEIK